MAKSGTEACPPRTPDNLIELADAKAREDRATALGRLVYAGAGKCVAELLAKERVSVSKAAELLDPNVHRVRLLARERVLQ